MPAGGSAARLQKPVEMKTRLLSVLARERTAGFKNLSGTHLDVTVPVTQRLVDLLVEVAAPTRKLGGLGVALRGADAITVTVVKPVLGFDARLALDMRIRGAGDVASDPRVYLVVDRPSFTWSAISRIAVGAGLAPAGVEIGRDGVAIDLRALADRAGFGDLIGAVRAVVFEEEAGVLRLRVVVRIPEGGTAAGGEATPPQGASQPRDASTSSLEAAEVLPELRGARVGGRLVAGEDLVNGVLAAVLDAARENGGPTPAGGGLDLSPQTLARWIQRATVRFENGTIVLEPDIIVT